MNIKGYVHEWLDKQADYREKERLPKLISIKAPEVMIKREKEIIESYKKKAIKIKGLDEFGNLEYSKFDRKKGTGGSVYYQFVTKEGLINFFPEGRYGMFISKNKTKEERNSSCEICGARLPDDIRDLIGKIIHLYDSLKDIPKKISKEKLSDILRKWRKVDLSKLYDEMRKLFVTKEKDLKLSWAYKYFSSIESSISDVEKTLFLKYFAKQFFVDITTAKISEKDEYIEVKIDSLPSSDDKITSYEYKIYSNKIEWKPDPQKGKIVSVKFDGKKFFKKFMDD